jgi:hypothetical protein
LHLIAWRITTRPETPRTMSLPLTRRSIIRLTIGNVEYGMYVW